jgi:hypothetical protein
MSIIKYGAIGDSKYRPKTHVWKGTVIMKTLKRLLTLFLVVLLSLSLVGCGKKEEPVEEESPEIDSWELEEEYDDSEDSWELDWEDTGSDDEEDSDSLDSFDWDWEDTDSEDAEDDDWGGSLE